MPQDYTTYDGIGYEPEVWFCCPNCGYDTRFPTRPEVWKQYEADGTLTLRQEVVEVQHIYALAERDVFMPVAVWLPTCVISGSLAQAGVLPESVFTGVLVGGAMAVLMFAVRYRSRVVETEPEPEPPTPLPEITEAQVDTALGPGHFHRFDKISVAYRSGEPVPDTHLWAMAMAFVRGVTFSRAMYTGETKCTSRPAYEALRDALINHNMAHMAGQDVVLLASGRSILRQWAAMDRPTFPYNTACTVHRAPA